MNEIALFITTRHKYRHFLLKPKKNLFLTNKVQSENRLQANNMLGTSKK